MNCVGSVHQSLSGQSSGESLQIVNTLKDAYYASSGDVSSRKSKDSIKFPSVSVQAHSEYHGVPIFCNAYPWLFPGGVGDIDESNITEHGYVSKWVKTMTLYYDGRFCRDPTFCFYALNFKQRHQNSVSGAFFINGFISNKTSLSELVQKITVENDTKFIDQLIHFSSKIRGSSAYWRAERLKVFSWINRLIELQLGPPTLFITLSCAEHYWKDVQRLLEDRTKFLPPNERPDLSTKAAVMKAIKDYSIVVQEFFITKVKHWLQNFAKKVLGINHYYCRFEFAEGRGEIHAHIIAVADNQSVYEEAYKCGNDTEKKVSVLEKYAEEKLGLTAIHPATSSQGMIDHRLIVVPEGSLPLSEVYSSMYSPCSKRLCEVTDISTDIIRLVNSTQTHKCGDYCLRKLNKSKRYCRAGCGQEMTQGSADTPCFPVSDKSVLRREMNGSVKLALRRNSSRMVQTSIKLLQMWRANCDVQLLIYDSDPRNPDLYEIGKVTDYVVSYACKGNATVESEREIMAALVER